MGGKQIAVDTVDAPPRTDRTKSKWRTGCAVALTGIWITSAIVYALHNWQDFVDLKPNSVGDMLAGFAAPLAFLWLVIGYFQQGEELELQRIELALQRMETKRLAEATEQQGKAVEANELHARRDTFMRYADLMLAHQAQLAAAIMPAAGGRGVEMAWTRFNQGDRDAFFGAILEYTFRSNSIAAIQEINANPAHLFRAGKFLENTEALLRECDKCDTDRVLRTFFEFSMMGSVYVGLCLAVNHKSTLQVRGVPDDISKIL